jgi:hypothetical protein
MVKSAVGRAHYCRTLLSQIRDARSAGYFARGAVIHGLGLARDVALDLLTSSGSKIRQSLGSADPLVVEKWNTVLGRLRQSATS